MAEMIYEYTGQKRNRQIKEKQPSKPFKKPEKQKYTLFVIMNVYEFNTILIFQQ